MGIGIYSTSLTLNEEGEMCIIELQLVPSKVTRHLHRLMATTLALVKNLNSSLAFKID